MMAMMITGLAACGSDNDARAAAPATLPSATPAPTAPTPALPTVGNVIAVTASNRVVSFDRAAPGSIATFAPLTNLAPGETPLGIDIRPTDKLVYAVGSGGRIHTVDPATGALVLKSTLGTAAGNETRSWHCLPTRATA